ncbi:MAG: hypothetical protein ACRYGR_06765 [Janthinobacterium lividum]
MSEIQKKPKLTKLERRAKALRDNLKKRKQQQAKRDLVKPVEIPSEPSLNPETLLPNPQETCDQNHDKTNQLQTIDAQGEINLTLKK